MIRHIEFTIDFDLTCWAEDMEDFGDGSQETIEESLYNYFEDAPYELINVAKYNLIASLGIPASS